VGSNTVYNARMSNLLDRDLSLAASADVRAAAAPVLREVIDFGLAAFQRCSATAEGHDTPMGVLFPFLHVFEMLDGVEIQLDKAAPIPATTTLRAAFEALLAMDWVAKEDSERRGAAYVVAEVHRRLARMERYDFTTERGKQLRAVLDSDELGKGLEFPEIPEGEKDREELRSLLDEPHLKTAAGEYDRTKQVMNRTPEFYALWGGPRDLESLARKLGRSAYYEILYRSWSGTAHANDLTRQLRHVDGQAAIARLRDGSELVATYAHAIHIGLQAIEVGLNKYRYDELKSFWTWYRSVVSPVYRRLTPKPSNVGRAV